MRLYYTPGACSLAPHIVAREADLPFDLVRVDLGTKKTADGADYLAVNSKGAVPALQFGDGFVLTEAAVVLQYLADQAPEAGLIPPSGSIERYVTQEWLNFIATELHKGFAPLWRKDTPADVREATKETLAAKFSYLDTILGERPFLAGAGFSVADAYAFTILGWAKFMAIDLARWPNLTAYLARVGARPKVHEALAAEGLLSTDEAA